MHFSVGSSFGCTGALNKNSCSKLGRTVLHPRANKVLFASSRLVGRRLGARFHAFDGRCSICGPLVAGSTVVGEGLDHVFDIGTNISVSFLGSFAFHATNDCG